MANIEEDWFYDSISRYKNLNMFEMEYPVHHMELASSNSICVFCSDNQQYQLLELVLPLKLTSQGLGGVITNDTDLKIKCGTFTSSRIANMRVCTSNRILVASHCNMNGVNFYQLTTDDSDEIVKTSLVDNELESPFLALSERLLVLTKTSGNPVILMDITTNNIIKNTVCYDKGSKENVVSPAFIDSQVVALCNHSTGRIQLYDSRECKLLNTDMVPGDKGSAWSFSTLYESTPDPSTQPTSLAMISNNSILRLFDSRNWSAPYVNTRLDIKHAEGSKIQVRFKPSDKDWISVSGFDGNVYVYKVDTEPKQVFLHDGHRHVEEFDSNTITSSHLWMPNIDNLIISSACNGTIQSWQFEDKTKQ